MIPDIGNPYVQYDLPSSPGFFLFIGVLLFAIVVAVGLLLLRSGRHGLRQTGPIVLVFGVLAASFLMAPPIYGALSTTTVAGEVVHGVGGGLSGDEKLDAFAFSQAIVVNGVYMPVTNYRCSESVAVCNASLLSKYIIGTCHQALWPDPNIRGSYQECTVKVISKAN